MDKLRFMGLKHLFSGFNGALWNWPDSFVTRRSFNCSNIYSVGFGVKQNNWLHWWFVKGTAGTLRI